MRAVVIYESMYGNTHQIAEAIGTGLAGEFDVAVVPVAEAGRSVVSDADLIVVGGPTHVHGMARASTRRAAAKAASKPDSPLQLEPSAPGIGLREWIGRMSKQHVKAAAFDTRLHGKAALTGSAAKGINRMLRARGFDVIAEPESFLVTKQDQLEPKETARAEEWGVMLAASMVPGAAPSTVPGAAPSRTG